MGTLASRIVGHMYLSPKLPDKVKIARLTFWGNRQDTVYGINQLEPFCDMSVNPKDVYFPVALYGTDDKIFFSLRYGRYRSIEDLVQIFGSIPKDWPLKKGANTLSDATKPKS